MSPPPTREVTGLLVAWSNGDQAAFEQLVPLAQAELQWLAHRYLGQERPSHLLQTSALVNEAYLRLIDWKNVQWQSRAHFFGVSAQLMRRILVDFARRRLRAAGESIHQVSLEEALVVCNEQSADLLALDEALQSLAQLDERKSVLWNCASSAG